ncbi:MAG: MBL fold metallo-hydrolase [Panacagrimonas sp.]
MRFGRQLLMLACLCLMSPWLNASQCRGEGVELQVLGSSGPELAGNRASTSYLLRHDGDPRVLVDIGGGAALRFGESGARVSDLELILLTHLHVDHSGDLPALVKASYFQKRKRDLPVLGPDAGGPFPSTVNFLERLFAANGAFAYLNDYLASDKKAKTRNYQLRPQNVRTEEGEMQLVYDKRRVQVWGSSVSHGIVPAVAWRVDIGGVHVAFGGDTAAKGNNLEILARNAHMLVTHNAVPEGVSGVARTLHMPPSRIGEIAAAAKVDQLVLAHRMTRALGKEAQTQAAIRKAFSGPILFGEDLACYPVLPPPASAAGASAATP